MEAMKTQPMNWISLDAAVAISGISKSTLWRRVTEGSIGKAGKDLRNRAMLAFADVLPLIDTPKPLSEEDVYLLLQADAGSSDAQADVGAMFYVARNTKAALYWLNEAAEQNNADAMHWLAIAHAARLSGEKARGQSIPAEKDARERDGNLAVMWLARAAALGHPLAQQQMTYIKTPR
ncbi:hypothetical protein [Comamonas sp.]|uniref:hypothetical protein n=1 Tax=Comamonas sp. TaxID=34028 RepID=UPI002897E849|nr:hypothetical protein [Comamonas sp.]